MIARFSVPLPFRIFIPESVTLSNIETDIEGKRAIIYPPRPSLFDTHKFDLLSEKPLYEQIEQLAPKTHPLQILPIATNNVLLNNEPTVVTNLIVVEVFSENFDRSWVRLEKTPLADLDPAVGPIFNAINHILMSLKIACRSPFVMPIDPMNNYWRVTYHKDDGSLCESNKDAFKGHDHSNFSLKVTPLQNDTWEYVRHNAFREANNTWNGIFIDAQRSMPEVGISLVLAATALETLVAWALDILVEEKQFNKELWDWLMKRDSYLKEPSVAEKYSELLYHISGMNLKDEKVLWQAFKEIKEARNKYVHEGVSTIGGRSVSVQDAEKLLGKASEIAAWIEQLLPTKYRRHVPPPANLSIKFQA